MLYSHILVPSDGSEASLRAIGHAVTLAGQLQARITFLHVQPPIPLPLSGLGDSLDPRTLEALSAASRQHTQQILAEAAAIAAEQQVPAGCEQRSGDRPHRCIVDCAAQLGCDLIVMASHGHRGLQGLLLGSETQRVLQQAPCPVLVHR